MTISRRNIFRLATLATLIALAPNGGSALAAGKVRIGVLKFGTVSWELDTLKHHEFDAANGIDLEVSYFAGEDATNVALLAGAIDMIVSDWLWVSRQRSEGGDVTLVPYSTAVGAIMVKQESPIRDDCRSQGQEDRRRRRSARQELAADPGAGQARPWHRSGGQQRDRLRRAAADVGKGHARRARCGAELLALLRPARGRTASAA